MRTCFQNRNFSFSQGKGWQALHEKERSTVPTYALKSSYFSSFLHVRPNVKLRFSMLVALFLWAHLVGTPSPVMAMTTIVSDPNNLNRAIGILGLEVDQMTFDVEFVNGSYNEVYGSDGAYFLGNSHLASLATEALVRVLNDEGVVLFPGYRIQFSTSNIMTPVTASPESLAGFTAEISFKGWETQFLELAPPYCSTSCLDGYLNVGSFARYTNRSVPPSPIPLPPAVLLFGTGLAALALRWYGKPVLPSGD